MKKVDYEWVETQLEQSHLPEDIGDAVVTLLETWETIDLDDAKTMDIIDAFVSLVQGHSIVPDHPDETWIEARMGFVHAGDRVRVKHNAFSGDAGKIHNGRLGKVSAVRSGDVIIRSTDNREPFLDGVHYPAYKLEVRVR